MTKSVLVTGSNGFIGSHLCRTLKVSGYQVFFYDGLIEDFNAVKKTLREIRPDWIVHLAGVSSVGKCIADPAVAYLVNLNGTVGLLEAMIEESPASALLFASTAQVYTASSSETERKAWSETRELKPQNLYARTKRAAEVVITEMTREFGLKSVIFRLFNHTHQSQSPDFFLPHLYEKICSGMTQIPVGNLDLWRDLGSVQDLLRAFHLGIERLNVVPGRAEVFNVCSGNAKRLGDLAEGLVQYLGRGSVQFTSSLDRIRSGEPVWIEGDASKLSRAVGWIPSAQSVDDLIGQFLAPI